MTLFPDHVRFGSAFSHSQVIRVGFAGPRRVPGDAQQWTSSAPVGRSVSYRHVTLQNPKHCLFEERQAKIDLLVADGKRRSKAEDAAHSRQLDNIHSEPKRHTLARDGGSKVGCNLFPRTAFDNLDTKQKPTPANVADTFKSLLKLPQPTLKPL